MNTDKQEEIWRQCFYQGLAALVSESAVAARAKSPWNADANHLCLSVFICGQ
jgi:hypothetical protein